MNHETFIADIAASLPEIAGAILFDTQSGVLAQHLENEIQGYNPAAIGSKITAIAKNAAGQINDITTMQITFDTMVLSCRQLPGEQWLLLLHAPELSAGMITMALQMALSNSANEEETPSPDFYETESSWQEEETEQPLEEEPEEELAFVDTEAMIAPGAPLAKQLNFLQEELASCIGPVAMPVFHELLTTWCHKHTPSAETLPQLVDLIEQEIDDPEEIKTFHANILSILS